MATKRRQLPPIPKAERQKVKRPKKFSVTLMGKWDTCHRSAFLYLKHKDKARSHALARGNVFHQFVEETVTWMRDEGLTEIPPESAKDRMMATIEGRRDLVLPEFEQQACRGMAWNWARATVLDAAYLDSILSMEQMLELDLGNWTFRGKPDLAQVTPFGYIDVIDYKTSLKRPSRDALEFGPHGFAGKAYSLLLLFGIPEGESLPLGSGVNTVRFKHLLPRWYDETTGKLLGDDFWVEYERDYLHDFRRSLVDHLTKMDQALKDGRWEAVDGAHCNECPAKGECPLPAEVDPYMEVDSYEDAQAAALAAHILSDAATGLRGRTRDFADANGHEAIYYGADYKLAFVPELKRSINWEEVGDGPVQPSQIDKSTSTKFTKRKITPEERADAE